MPELNKSGLLTLDKAIAASYRNCLEAGAEEEALLILNSQQRFTLKPNLTLLNIDQ